MFNEQRPKRESPIERVIGPGFETEDYELAQEYLRQRFKIQDFESLRGVEREKTEEEKEIINWVNDNTNELLILYDARPIDIPSSNIHIIPDRQWFEKIGLENAAAFYNFSIQGILYRDTGLRSLLAYSTFHETLHIKFHQAAQYVEGRENKGLVSYRSGLGLSSEKRENFETQFRKINEAVIETLAINFWDERISKDERFGGEIKNLGIAKDVLRNNRKDWVGENDLSEEEVETWLDELNAVIVPEEPGEKSKYIYFSYPDERAALGYLINALYESNRKIFKTSGEIFDLFVKSAITGHMVELAKLIDKTGGTGTFERLGEMSSQKHSKEEFINYIKTF